MKKIYIIWIMLCSFVLAMENIEDRESQSWLPKWSDVKTYMGFGISCETKIPSHTAMRAAYGAFSMLFGAAEILTS